MVKIDETTQQVLEKSAADLSRREPTISARMELHSATGTASISKSKRKLTSPASTFLLTERPRERRYLFR